MVEGISVIIPAYSPIAVTSNSVISVVKQQLGKTNRPKVDLVLMNDDIENPKKYDYFLSEDFRRQFYEYNKEEVSIKIVDNRKYMTDNFKLFQGGSRLFGMLKEAKYDYCILLDDDDILAPNTVRMYTDILNKEMEKSKDTKISTVGAIFRSFDEGCNQNDIGKDQFSIWVQGRLWNRQFLIENNINDSTLYKNKINRRQGEDYLFVSVFDYINSKQPEWQRILTKDFICGFWIPNYNSLSRQDPFYGQHLAGSTMSSSYTIYEYMKAYSKSANASPADDEELKQRLLNMTIYSMYNLYDFIITVSSTEYKPKEEDWYLLRDYCNKLKEALKEYYDEIQENDIVVTNANIIEKSDCRVHNLFEGSFFDYMNKEVRWFNYDYDKMVEEAKKLHYDGVNILESKQCKAWRDRHAKH